LPMKRQKVKPFRICSEETLGKTKVIKNLSLNRFK
jgi:hypothetical protein